MGGIVLRVAERSGGRHSSSCLLSLQNILKTLSLNFHIEDVERRGGGQKYSCSPQRKEWVEREI